MTGGIDKQIQNSLSRIVLFPNALAYTCEEPTHKKILTFKLNTLQSLCKIVVMLY